MLLMHWADNNVLDKTECLTTCDMTAQIIELFWEVQKLTFDLELFSQFFNKKLAYDLKIIG